MQFDKAMNQTAERIVKFHQLKGCIIIGIGENDAHFGVSGLDYATCQTLIDALKETVNAPKSTLITPLPR